MGCVPHKDILTSGLPTDIAKAQQAERRRPSRVIPHNRQPNRNVACAK